MTSHYSDRESTEVLQLPHVWCYELLRCLADGAMPAMREVGDENGVTFGWWIWMDLCQWPFQDPKLEVPTIYKAYVRLM